jgi:hypothetical protein
MHLWSQWKLTEFVYGLNAARRGEDFDPHQSEGWIAGWWHWTNIHNASMPSVEYH